MPKTKKPNSKIVLGIETSCDETAVSLIEATMPEPIYHGTEVIEPNSATENIKGPKIKIIGNALYSQADKHAEFGGVFPTLAKREHTKNISAIFTAALKESGLYKLKSTRSKITSEQEQYISETLKNEKDMTAEIIEILETIEKPHIDLISVTQGPGLEPALWVGINFAKVLSKIWNISVVPTNHMEGHILSVMIDSKTDFAFPALALLISGGHTELVLIKNWHEYSVIGRTRDDAVGEAYDKVARILGFEYPGGPKISKLANLARERREKGELINENVTLPRPMINSGDSDFSFSGLKTAALYLVKKMGELSETDKQDVAEEFENAVTEVLIKKTRQAMIDNSIRTLIIGGGVIANSHIRSSFQKMTELEFVDVKLMVPEIEHSTDNAVMIAVAGFMRFSNNPSDKQPNKSEVAEDPHGFRASGNLSL